MGISSQPALWRSHSTLHDMAKSSASDIVIYFSHTPLQRGAEWIGDGGIALMRAGAWWLFE
jgi:hypothetical protein